MFKNSVIIIDDETGIRNNLKYQLRLLQPDITIIDEAENVQKGIALLTKHEPDIVFLDIEMPDGTGFEVVKQCPNLKAKVIFITAHNHYAVQAFKVSALDYLLKPIDMEDLENALQKANNALEKENMQVKIHNFLENAETKQKKIVLKNADSIAVVAISDIIRLEASDNYTIFYIQNSPHMLISKTLKEYEELLEEYDFFRIHQSHLINLHFFQRYEKKEGGFVVMKDNSILPLASRKKDVFLKMLEQL